MERYRFNVFGDIVLIERRDSAWRCFSVGADGKLGFVDLAVPSEVSYEELPQYLYDIFHESAASSDGDICEIV